MRSTLVCCGLALGAVVALPASASGDTAPIPASPGLSWTDPAHSSPLELLASRIASHIAGREVSVRCEDDSAWAALVTQAGGDPGSESGFVATQWNGASGQLLWLSSVAELSGAICGPLQQFAQAASKPTKCLVRRARLLAAPRANRSRTVATPVPCYLGGGRTAARETPGYWTAYENYSIAILTLAHESIHLGGIVGGTLSNGLGVGDPRAEAKADCFGMQWMPYVAEQLGDTPDDAQAIARYFWDKIYGLSRTTHP